jgi:hypothetical protein
MAPHVQTDLRAAVVTGAPTRGIRQWRYAELSGSCLFMVEHCLRSKEKCEWIQLVTADPRQCSRLLAVEESQHARVYGYVRLRPHTGCDHIFGELVEIFVSLNYGDWLLRFSDGTVARVANGNVPISIATTEQLQRVFPESF